MSDCNEHRHQHRKFPVLKMMAVITSHAQALGVSELLEHNHVHMLHQFHAEGTANSEMLQLFGLGGTAKILTAGIVPGAFSAQLLKEITSALHLNSDGKGIAFTVPLSGIAGQAMTLLNDEYLQKIDDKIDSEVDKMKAEVEYSLIVASINQGYSEELMEAAHKAGAGGGTVWAARKAGIDSTVKLLGITIQGEREIVSILTPKDKKLDIMKAITASCGIVTPAQGIIFSMPVDQVAGLREE